MDARKAPSKNTVIDGDVLMIGGGTLTDVSVKGQWFYFVERDLETTDLPILSERQLASITSLNLDDLPIRSNVQVNGDVYFHPDAVLLQEGTPSCSAISLACLSKRIKENLSAIHHDAPRI